MIFPRHTAGRLKLFTFMMLFGTSMLILKTAVDLGGYLGDALFTVLSPHLAVTSEARPAFEGIGAIIAFLIAAVIVGWLWYRLILLWRRVKAWIADYRRPPVLVHPQ